jgi:hypothetical protein
MITVIVDQSFLMWQRVYSAATSISFPQFRPRCPAGLIFRESRAACHIWHGKPGCSSAIARARLIATTG